MIGLLTTIVETAHVRTCHGQVGLIATRNFHLYADGVLTCDPDTDGDPFNVSDSTP